VPHGSNTCSTDGPLRLSFSGSRETRRGGRPKDAGGRIGFHTAAGTGDGFTGTANEAVVVPLPARTSKLADGP
jgi:hypothetical protein